MKQRKDQRGPSNSTVHVMKLLYRHSPRTVSNKQRESKLKSRFPRNSTDTGKEVSFLVTRGAETARERKRERREEHGGWRGPVEPLNNCRFSNSTKAISFSPRKKNMQIRSIAREVEIPACSGGFLRQTECPFLSP